MKRIQLGGLFCVSATYVQSSSAAALLPKLLLRRSRRLRHFLPQLLELLAALFPRTPQPDTGPRCCHSCSQRWSPCTKRA